MDYRIAVVAIVEYDGQVLVGKKKEKPGHAFSGRWHLPGGGEEANETDKQALEREIGEEAGIQIRIERFLDERVDRETNIKSKYFVCSPLTHNLRAGDDLVEVKYVPKDDVLKVCDSRDFSLWPPQVREYFGNERS